MRTITALCALPLLAACAYQVEPVGICDREGQLWNKFDTQEDDCTVRKPIYIPGLPPQDDPHDPCCVTTPPHEPPTEPPHEPPTEPPHEPPAERAKGNNGLGNGDQTAPGGSLDNNKAENERDNPGHNSGKKQNSN